MISAEMATENTDGKVRHTFHLHQEVLDKLRDVITYIQAHPQEYAADERELLGNLSRFAVTAVIEKILALETNRKKDFPRRRKGQSVHFGRPRGLSNQAAA